MRICITLILMLMVFPALSQESIIICTDSTFCVPSVHGMPRSKGFSIQQERVLNYRITSDGSDGGLSSSEDEVELNRRWEVKLRFPVLLKPNLKLAVGLEYFHEEYRFEGLPNNDFPFYQSLENKDLRSIGASAYLVKPWLGKRYFIMRVGVNLNGDENFGGMFNSDFLKVSVAPLLGWKHSPFTSFAVGLAYSYDFGRQSIYPIFSYNHTFNSRWGVESILPLNVKLRHTKNDKNIFYATTELNGASYNVTLNGPEFENRQGLILRKSEIRFLLKYEREIHDWLWFGLEAGLRSNIEFSLRESNERNAVRLIENEFNSALVLNASIFIVPPRKFLD